MGNRLEGKVAIITGATSGIGKACVEAFVREGAKVVFAGRREERGKAIETKLRAIGGDVLYVKADLTQEMDCKKVVSACIEQYKQVDVLINDAGTGTIVPFHEMDLKKDYDDVVNLNIRSYAILCKEVIPHMIKRQKGNIINVASIGGLAGMPMQASYAVSKGGVIQLSMTLAVEYAKNGIRVNTISPGLTITEMVPAGSEAEKLLKRAVPGGNVGTAEGVANAAVFAASDETPFMTGTNIIIDGGATCMPSLF